MSVAKQISDMQERDKARRTEWVKLMEYLNSDKVRELVESFIETVPLSLIERGDDFRLYLQRDKLEVYEYEMIDIREAKINFPILDKIFYRTKESKVVKSYPSFVARLNDAHSFTIEKMNLSVRADDFIKSIDKLLFG